MDLTSLSGGAAGVRWVFEDPAWLWIALALPIVAWLRGRMPTRVLVLPFSAAWWGGAGTRRAFVPALLYVAAVCLVVAVARPQRLEDVARIDETGFDIVLAVDISGTMLAEDYSVGGAPQNRLQALRQVLDAFTARRTHDRIAAIAFAKHAYTLSPLTSRHDWLRDQLARLRIGAIEEGTAIGNALALAVARLDTAAARRSGEVVGRFVVLLTDGDDNAGFALPETAAALAAERGIRVFTVGAGRPGMVDVPRFDEKGRRVGTVRIESTLNEALLRDVAATTGGAYFRADDFDSLRRALASIDAENPLDFEPRIEWRVDEYFPHAAWSGFACCAVAVGLVARGRWR